MLDIWSHRFSFDELLMIIGLIQTLSLLVHVLFHAESYKRAGVAILFFAWLFVLFVMDYAAFHLMTAMPVLGDLQKAAWFMLVPFSVLVLYPVLLLERAGWGRSILLGGMVAGALGLSFTFFAGCGAVCTERDQALMISGILAGSLALLTLWSTRDTVGSVYRAVHLQGRERYWLVICLLVLCCGILTLSALELSGALNPEDHVRVRTILGLTFAYVAGTSFFRVSPYPLDPPQVTQGATMAPLHNQLQDANDQELLRRINDLLVLQKVYQEPSYGRGNLARELGISESVLSRLVNLSFDQSVPQLLNMYRVEDAKRLLCETEAPIKVVAAESGFNSIPTFNRVFRHMTGVTPSEYRQSATTDARINPPMPS